MVFKVGENAFKFSKQNLLESLIFGLKKFINPRTMSDYKLVGKHM